MVTGFFFNIPDVNTGKRLNGKNMQRHRRSW